MRHCQDGHTKVIPPRLLCLRELWPWSIRNHSNLLWLCISVGLSSVLLQVTCLCLSSLPLKHQLCQSQVKTKINTLMHHRQDGHTKEPSPKLSYPHRWGWGWQLCIKASRTLVSSKHGSLKYYCSCYLPRSPFKSHLATCISLWMIECFP